MCIEKVLRVSENWLRGRAIVFAVKRCVWMLPSKGKEARRFGAELSAKLIQSQGKWVLNYI